MKSAIAVLILLLAMLAGLSAGQAPALPPTATALTVSASYCDLVADFLARYQGDVHTAGFILEP